MLTSPLVRLKITDQRPLLTLLPTHPRNQEDQAVMVPDTVPSLPVTLPDLLTMPNIIERPPKRLESKSKV